MSPAGECDGYDALLAAVEMLEGALAVHRQHVIDSASMAVLPSMVGELHDLDRRVSAIRQQCEGRLPVGTTTGQTPLV